MNVELDAESKTVDKVKGQSINRKNLEVNACCAPGVQEVVAVPGKPKTLNQYNEVMSIIYQYMYKKGLAARKNLHLNYLVLVS